WKSTTKQPITSTPIVENGVLYVGCNDGSFKAFDLATGNMKWETTGIVGNIDCKATISQNKIFFTTWAGMIYGLNLADGTIAWQYQFNDNTVGMNNPTVVNNMIVLNAHGKIHALDVKDGNVMYTSESIQAKGTIAYNEQSNTIVTYSTADTLYAYQCQTTTLSKKWMCNTQCGEFKNNDQPTVNDDVIVVSGKNGELSAVNVTDGSLLWRHKYGNCLTHVTSFAKNKWVITTSNGDVAMLSFE
ncbi:MAG: PQQ-binding-like beta-propeller repeat protein, partial [Bacteroidales bacterium]|nr:PQQ-binding-like beta-propeller repeat protein [Bacteroidales bacterium]